MVVTKRATGRRAACLALLCTLLGPPAWSAMYRWVDDQGRVHYSDRPPERARAHTLLDRQGRTLRQVSPAESSEPDTGSAARSQIRARERQDRALLSTYSDEAEIDRAREQALAYESLRLNSLNSLIAQARRRQSELEAQIAALTRGGGSPPPSLAQQLEDTRGEITQLEQQIARSQQNLADIAQRYEAYKRRFRELKGMAADKRALSPAVP
ncbi:MAG: DUF4124 domain-containing protein [Thiobacillaceae bacterium]|nr:DUF4124 domain-containing protein [Thiobacillaceae bacterium]